MIICLLLGCFRGQARLPGPFRLTPDGVAVTSRPPCRNRRCWFLTAAGIERIQKELTVCGKGCRTNTAGTGGPAKGQDRDDDEPRSKKSFRLLAG